MKKLHSYAFYALVAPAISLSSAAVLAQQPAGQDSEHERSTPQHDQGATATQLGQDATSTRRDPGASATTGQNLELEQEVSQRPRQTESQTAAERLTTAREQSSREQSQMKQRGYMDSIPANGMQLSKVMGANVFTANDEDVGVVDDLIIDEDGQIVAIVVGVGGFLGMGKKDVAIGWGHVTQSHDNDEHQLRIDVTRQELQSAPEVTSLD